MAVIKVVNSKASIGKAIKYITKEEKTEEKLISGKDCSPETAIDEMKTTKEQWKKTKGRQYKHYIQSFDPNDSVTASKVHQIGCEWANQFKGHEVLISTHVDKGHIHNHFIVNTVNFENGKKFQQSKKDLARLKKHSDKICEREGLSVIKEISKEITAFSQAKYKAIEKGFTGKGKSYLLETAKTVNYALTQATDKESFIKTMESKGYKVNWKDDRKNITFTTPEGKKVRNSNLEKTFKEHKFSKEGMENEIQRDRERATNGINKTSRAKHESKNGVRKHTPQREFGGIEERIRRVEQGIKGDNGESRQENTQSSPIKRDIDTEPKKSIREPKSKVRERGFDFER